MATHSSVLAWRIPWTEKPGRLQSMGSLRVDTTEQLPFHFSLSCIGKGNGNPLQCSCLENPRDGRAWWAAVYGITQSRTRLKQLSSSSSSRRWREPALVFFLLPPLLDNSGFPRPRLSGNLGLGLAAAAAAKLLQSCPTLCDPTDGSPPGYPVPGILQSRTLEWVAISFSNAWK